MNDVVTLKNAWHQSVNYIKKLNGELRKELEDVRKALAGVS